jgi:hypothetical protein
MSKKVICDCKDYEGIYTIVYEPGHCEAVVQCKNCRRLWYSLLLEKRELTFSGEEFEEYQIPITITEYKNIKKTKYKDMNLNSLSGRKARIILAKGIIEISSEFALGRCGRLSLPGGNHNTNNN